MPRSPDATDAEVGRRIHARRSALGLSQSALAQRLGISPQQVQKYEAGTNRISASRLSAIAAVLGVGPGALFPAREDRDGERDGEAAGAGPEPGPDDRPDLGFMTATMEGRAVAAAFPLIPDPTVRQALARIVGALGPSS